MRSDMEINRMASQASLDFVQSLYVAYYGRPADSAGQMYWAERADAEGQGAILDAFGNSEEFTQEYGDLGNDELVDSLYQQLFGRSADATGQSYYAGILASGDKSLSEIAVTIMNAAQGSDIDAIDARTEVAQYYTDNVAEGEYDVDEAQSLISEVDGETSEQQIAAAKAEIDASTGDEQTPPADGGDEQTPPADEQIQVVDGGEITADNRSFSLGDNQAIRFTGVDSNETINVDGLTADKTLMVEGSKNITLNLDTGSAASAQLGIANSAVTLSGIQQDSTLTSLAVDAAGDSSLEMNGSIAGPLENLEITGDSGSFELTGAAVGSAENGADIDASGYGGDVTIGDGVLDNATSVTTGSGDDTLTVDDISGGDTAMAIDGGEGNDSLTVTDSLSPDSGYIESNVSGFESFTFEGYSKVDAEQLSDAQSFSFQSGGDLAHLTADQNVVATAAGMGEDGSPMILRDAGDSVNVEAVNAEGADSTLDLKVLKTADEFTGGTMNLTGDANVNYEASGRQFDDFDASGLDGDLTYTGADYAQENIELGSGAASISVATEETDDEGVATGNMLATSSYENMDVVTGFDLDGDDTLTALNGDAVTLTDVTSNVSDSTDLDAAFTAAADTSAAADAGYVSFEFDDATYVYSNSDGEGVTADDFALKLGVQESTAADAVA
ncbi:DUF4214 domain-containing protein [Salinicola sp. 4072]|uniref:DUF4214 domain-containing protein n=1 Tax=Salinicola sp. 4072 TaxID=3082157 RepID=UPI003B532FC9